MCLDFWIFGIWKFLAFLDFKSTQSFPGNVLLALYAGFGGYLTFDSGFEFGDLGFLDFGLVWDFRILIAINSFQNMQVMFF